MRGSVSLLRRALTATVASLALASVAGLAHADTTFDTTPFWDGSSSIQPFGNPDTATYGQTFVAPTDTLFQDFTFYVNAPTGVTLQFTGNVYQWSGSLLGGGGGGAVGPSLYTSASTVLNGNDAFQVVTMAPNICLTAGEQYVAFLTVSDPTDYAATTGTSVWGVVGSHVANSGGGGFVFYNNGNNPGLLNTTAWDNFADFGDLAWQADFVPCAVPEPGAVATGVILFGGMGLGLIRGRRSRKS